MNKLYREKKQPFAVLSTPALIERTAFAKARRRRVNQAIRDSFFLPRKHPTNELPAIQGARQKEERVVADRVVTSKVTLPSLVSRLEEVMDSWMSYELDPMKYLSFPLITDVTDAKTAAFVVSMEKAKRALSAAVEPSTSQESFALKDLESLVEDAEVSFRAAEYNAKKNGLSYLSTDERQAVNRAASLDAIMTDEEAAPNERRMAYEQANKILEGVLPPLNPRVIGLLGS